MKNNKLLIQFKKVPLKIVISTFIFITIGIVSVGSIYSLNYNSSTSGINKYIKVGSRHITRQVIVAKHPEFLYKTQYGVTTSNVSIRTGASISYSIQGTFANNTPITIIAPCGDFYKVSYIGESYIAVTGFVSNHYVKITKKPVIVSSSTIDDRPNSKDNNVQLLTD